MPPLGWEEGCGGEKMERPPGEAASSLTAKAARGVGGWGSRFSFPNITAAPIKRNSALREVLLMPWYRGVLILSGRPRLPLSTPAEKITYAFPAAASSRNRRNANEVGSIVPTSRDFAPCSVRTTTI